MKLLRLLAVGAIAAFSAVALSSCETTPEAQAKAEQVFNTICKNEPAAYATFQLIAEVRHASEKTLQKGKIGHEIVTDMCTNRPTDLVSGVIQIAAAYAKVLSATQEVPPLRPPV